jgi:cholesterol transport system auxiliary component
VNPNQLSILVLPTVASPEVNTRKMAYAPTTHQIAYYAENSWVAMPTQMLLPLITQALRKSDSFYAVVPAPFAGKTNLILYTQLLNLEQNFTTHPSAIHMTLAAQVVDVDSGKILGAHQFSVAVPTPEDNPAGGAFAANQATAQILQELTQFCMQVSRIVNRP